MDDGYEDCTLYEEDEHCDGADNVTLITDSFGKAEWGCTVPMVI